MMRPKRPTREKEKTSARTGAITIGSASFKKGKAKEIAVWRRDMISIVLVAVACHRDLRAWSQVVGEIFLQPKD